MHNHAHVYHESGSMKEISIFIAFLLLTDIISSNNNTYVAITDILEGFHDGLDVEERRFNDALEGFNWTDGKSIIPYENVPLMDVFMLSPTDPDYDLVSEGLKVKEQVMYDLKLLMTHLKKNHPFRVSPLRKVTFNQWKKDYEDNLDYMIDELRRTRHMKYPEKMQSWLEFRLGIEHMFKVVGSRWIGKFLADLPTGYRYWRERINKLRRREARLLKELDELRKGKPKVVKVPGISSGKKTWKKKTLLK